MAQSIPHVYLQLESDLLSRFAQVFSKGVGISTRTGCSIKDFICEQLGIQEEYLEGRIQTIFLNGKPVDDVDTSVIADGSMLALSAAMPGLVGAIMRRGGYYAAMRNTITHESESSTACAQDGIVTVKLFNLTAKELGPLLLQRGVSLEGSDLKDVLSKFKDDFRRGCKGATLNGEQITIENLIVKLEDKDSIYLQINPIQD